MNENTSRLNKHLWTNITRLKLYAEGDDEARFELEKNPFDDPEDEKVAAARDVYIVSGRVFPKTGLYTELGFRIEILLTSKYPQQAPEVRFLSPMHHPNIEKDGKSYKQFQDRNFQYKKFFSFLGKFCHEILNNQDRWKKWTTLVDVIKIVAKHVNNPDPEYAVSYGKQTFKCKFFYIIFFLSHI